MTESEWWREAGARADAATPGPWEFDDGHSRFVVAPSGVIAEFQTFRGRATPDASFIASARSDVPRLVATLDAIAAVLALDHEAAYDLRADIEAVLADGE